MLRSFMGYLEDLPAQSERKCRASDDTSRVTISTTDEKERRTLCTTQPLYTIWLCSFTGRSACMHQCRSEARSRYLSRTGEGTDQSAY